MIRTSRLRLASLLGLGLVLLAVPAVGNEDALAAALRRAEAAEKRAQAAEKRVKELEARLKAKQQRPTARKAPHSSSESAADRAAERETTRRLDDAITRQHLRDAGR